MASIIPHEGVQLPGSCSISQMFSSLGRSTRPTPSSGGAEHEREGAFQRGLRKTMKDIMVCSVEVVKELLLGDGIKENHFPRKRNSKNFIK